MQVSGGSQSFNAVNSWRLLGRWMRKFTPQLVLYCDGL
jgi:arsenic resistance protein ArsH